MAEAPASPAGGRLANVSAALLLGGEPACSADQADLFAVRTTRLLASLFEEVLVVGGAAPAEVSGRLIPETSGPACPLRGVVAALEAASEERVLVLGMRHPLVTPDLLLGLTAWPEAAIVAPRFDSQPQPLCAVYLREAVLPAARERLASSEPNLLDLIASVECGWLEGADLASLDPDGDALFRIAAPEDATRAVERLGR